VRGVGRDAVEEVKFVEVYEVDLIVGADTVSETDCWRSPNGSFCGSSGKLKTSTGLASGTGFRL
jgi:hypothetical protein